MGRITDGFKDQIRDQIRVSDIAGKHLKLKRQGREFAGLSPFTNEKTPSFFVNDEKQFYHCFSSGKHGDVFALVMELENLSFMESVKRLADLAGLDMPQYTPQAKAEDERRKLIYAAMNDAQDLFVKTLYSDAGKIARDYLKSRGIDKDVAVKWGLGMAPPGYQTFGSLMRHHRKDVLLAASLLSESPRGDMGFFRNRLTFPVWDRQGRVVTFSARALDPDGKPKYLNGKASPVFDKSKTLYAANTAKDAIAKNRDAQGLVISEGCMDVVALGRAGCDIAVAPLGTSITNDHLSELWRYGAEPVACMDGDKAGRRAAMRLVDLALPRISGGRTIKFAMMPDGQDPDDILRQSGPDAVMKIINNPISMPRLIWEYEQTAGPLDSPERRAGFRTRLNEYVAKIKDSDTARHYRDAFFNWTREHYNRGSKSLHKKNLQGANIVRHRGMGVLIRCIDNPGLFPECDEDLMGAKWGPESQKIFDAAMNAYMADIDISRELIVDGLLADMQTNAAQAILAYPRLPPILPGSKIWDDTKEGIRALGRMDKKKPRGLAAAIARAKES